jgi:DNA-binding response OmpR family regulator
MATIKASKNPHPRLTTTHAPVNPPQPLQVLVVEDHTALRDQIASLLKRAGHSVEEASSGRMALHCALTQPPDVLLLDIGLPDLSGLEVCRLLREQSLRQVPVLMLTARDTLPDKLEGFAAGADDYLVKPFEGEELLVRLQALARRRTIGQDYLLRIGSVSIDRLTQEVHRNGKRLALTPTAFAILLHLADAYPRALTRSELVHRVWGDEPPESDPLRTHLYLLRHQLDRGFAQPILRTVHGVGYRLEADEQGTALP